MAVLAGVSYSDTCRIIQKLNLVVAGATSCVSGTVCTVLNPYYSQCLPGSAVTSTVSSASSHSSSASSQSGSTTSSAAGTGPSGTPTAGNPWTGYEVSVSACRVIVRETEYSKRFS